MNYSAYYPTDVLNGEGVRAVLFVSGCSHGCKGCYNESTWDPRSGKVFTSELLEQIIEDLKDTRIVRQGLSLTGGDPLHRNNLMVVDYIINRVRQECPDKDIWLWSGFTLDEVNAETNLVLRKQIVNNVDVFIDGRFEKDLHDPSLAFRGSSNQIIHKMKV